MALFHFNKFRAPYSDTIIIEPDIHKVFIDLSEFEFILFNMLGFSDKKINELENNYLKDNYEVIVLFNENKTWKTITVNRNNELSSRSYSYTNDNIDFYDSIRTILSYLNFDKDIFFKSLKRRNVIKKLLTDEYR